MGICGSKLPIDEAIKKLCDTLHITSAELKRFYKLFKECDQDASGTISMNEFIQAFDCEFTPFAKECFTAMDVTRGGPNDDFQLDFEEFFVGIWNFLSLDHDSLVRFTFSLVDRDGSNSIEKGEMMKLLLRVYGKKRLNEQVTKILRSLDADQSGSISLNEAMAMQKRIPSLMMPAFTLQQQLKSEILGTNYWRDAVARRQTYCPDDLIELFYFLKNNTKLCRAEIIAKAKQVREGHIIMGNGGGATLKVLSAPESDAPVVATFKVGQKIIVYGEKWAKVANGLQFLWYNLDGNATQWVPSSCIGLYDNKSTEFRVAEEEAAAKDRSRMEELLDEELGKIDDELTPGNKKPLEKQGTDSSIVHPFNGIDDEETEEHMEETSSSKKKKKSKKEAKYEPIPNPVAQAPKPVPANLSPDNLMAALEAEMEKEEEEERLASENSSNNGNEKKNGGIENIEANDLMAALAEEFGDDDDDLKA
eukprot:TRINITY_DN2921_c0_g1_i3.p1 TRINITY_DN2921_c0_g1~~TRINITY_DN2921_c0_g1_i3.p1  ORF type:complete len:477 (+),score=151.66 TRINITY_DN2921_c0_g1_i3:129-1559(+)